MLRRRRGRSPARWTPTVNSLVPTTVKPAEQGIDRQDSSISARCTFLAHQSWHGARLSNRHRVPEGVQMSAWRATGALLRSPPPRSGTAARRRRVARRQPGVDARQAVLKTAYPEYRSHSRSCMHPSQPTGANTKDSSGGRRCSVRSDKLLHVASAPIQFVTSARPRLQPSSTLEMLAVRGRPWS